MGIDCTMSDSPCNLPSCVIAQKCRFTFTSLDKAYVNAVIMDGIDTTKELKEKEKHKQADHVLTYGE